MEHRARAARACDECRRLKEKCEGGLPCRRCAHYRRLCEFKGSLARTRGFRAYIPREAQGTSDFRELNERSKYMERILKCVVDGISLDTKSLAKLAESLEANGDTRRVASDPKDVEGLAVVDEACTMDPVGDTTTHFSGEFSYWNFSMRIKHHIDSQMEQVRGQDSDCFDNYARARELRVGHNHLSAAIECLPPRQVAHFLARTFLNYAETYYFFVEKTWLFEQIDSLYDGARTLTKKGGEVIISIILTVLAIGTQYAHLESSGHGSPSTAGQTFSEENVGATFYQQAIRLLPEIIELSSLESVQACLLFGYYALPIDASGLGYIYINLAIRLGMQNGIHRKCKNGAFDPAMVKLRNHVWWTAYSLERKISIFHGRPLSVLRSDVDADLHLGDSSPAISRAIASIKLVHFLEDLLHEIAALQNSQKEEIPNIVSRLLIRRNAVTMWWNSLPKEVVGSEAQQSTLTRCAVHLRLEYCLLRMFVGRPFLLKNRTPQFNKDSPTDSASTNASNPAPTSSAGQEQLPDLIRDCIQAAREALELCQQLRDSGPGLARASYIEYSSCRASLLVLIAYSIQNFSEQFRKALCDGLEMIREMSAAGESARSEVSLIESLERALARLHAGTQHSRASNETSQFGVSVSGYDAFRHWGVNLRGSSAIGSSVQAIGHPEAHLEISSLPIWRPPAFDRHTRNRMVDFDCNASLVACSGSFNAEPLNAFDPVIQMPLFGAEDGSLLGEWPTYTEAQMLEQFITVPDYEVAEETTIGTR